MLQITELQAYNFMSSPDWKVQAEGDCLVWQGPKTTTGYGYIKHKGHQYLTHRIAYVARYTEIPDLVVDHKCRNRACVNTEHLIALTRGENIMQEGSQSIQRLNSEKTHCKHGHALTFDNLNKANLRRGQRDCKICSRQRARVYRARNRNKILTEQMNANENLNLTE